MIQFINLIYLKFAVAILVVAAGQSAASGKCLPGPAVSYTRVQYAWCTVALLYSMQYVLCISMISIMYTITTSKIKA